MRKEIFESEEEYISVFSVNGIIVDHAMIKTTKELGLIKKSIVDEAEEMYLENVDKYYTTDNLKILVSKQHEAIQYLKKQLEQI